jgi:5-methylcytosine-specific restriction endonuclease McrA
VTHRRAVSTGLGGAECAQHSQRGRTARHRLRLAGRTMNAESREKELSELVRGINEANPQPRQEPKKRRKLAPHQRRKRRTNGGCLDCGVEVSLRIGPGYQHKRCEACRAIHNTTRVREYAKQYRNTKRGRVRLRTAQLTFSRGPKGRALKSRKDAMRRSRIEAAGESVDPKAVFERDHWTCGICHKPIDQQPIDWWRSESPTIDHIVPLAAGGSHTASNLQAAHRRCNLEKGARLAC